MPVAAPSPSALTTKTPAAAPLRVLHAEDDPQIAGIVALYFEQHGNSELTHVTSGRACLEAMARGGYDLLLVDLIMPDLNGLQVLGELTARRDPTPVIMVSGNGQSPLAVRALRAGAVDCIDKNSPDFRRIAEIAHRAVARQRRPLAAGALPARSHRVLYLDPVYAERSIVTTFLHAHAPLLDFSSAAPTELATTLVHALTPFDAIILGPGLTPNAMLDLLRHLRSRLALTPILVLAAAAPGETAIAAFKLGAHDYLLRSAESLHELVFSLNQALKHADTERLNARLTDELAALNHSLADQVASRTRELENENRERRAAEERARGLATRLLRAREDERRVLAQDLHDQVGQLLTGLRFQLEAAQPTAPALTETLALTDELLGTVRELTLQLRPRILDDFGLRPALEWHTRRFATQTGIAIELDVALPNQRLAPELETVVFRLVQEALTNVARHSGATAATVTVAADTTTLHVEISDRGCGCDATAALATHDSLGLAGAAERVRLAEGSFELFSQPGQGTRLHAEFPLNLSLSS
jgi:signal transduction histidine kinase